MAKKENGPTTRTYLAEAGFAVASIRYRTVLNGATFADGVADVKSAVRYLRAQAVQAVVDKFGASDLARIAADFDGDVAAGLPWPTREVLDRAVAFLSSHLAGRSS
jgi:hypothetical protein